jgi:hypothetical protein
MTTAPPGAALPVSVTVPVEMSPPIIEFGENEIEATLATSILRVADFDTEPSVPEITAGAFVDTTLVVTMKVELADPSLTATNCGTEALLLSDDRVTTTPPDGA